MGCTEGEHENCDCIFCNSKCLECESTNVRVKYSGSFEYENETENSIHLYNSFGEIELECNECGALFED